jgi:hypothetical protein
MPDANGNIKGIAISGKASESWERIFGDKPRNQCPAAHGASCCGYYDECREALKVGTRSGRLSCAGPNRSNID